MQAITPIDIFATKGIEYLIVIAFLVVLGAYWRFLNRSTRAVSTTNPARAGAPLSDRRRPGNVWFAAPDDCLFHQGHAWLRPQADGVVTVGVDDFAQKLIGKPDAVDLPQIGGRLRLGEPAWTLSAGGRSVRMVSPVDGEVVQRNEAVIESPSAVNRAPYGDGWLLRIRVEDPESPRRNLLAGSVVSAWLDGVTERLRTMWTREIGTVLPDGGVPVAGFAREMSPASWNEVAEEFLLVRPGESQ